MMKPSALVVDDDPTTRIMLSEVLRAEGYSVQTAEHGGPALAIMRASQEHLLVTLGLIMPEVDGMAVLEGVTADESLAHRHAIVVVSAAVGMLNEGRGTELRQQLDLLLVEKPFTYEQLLDALEEAERRWAAQLGVKTPHIHIRQMACKWASISTAGRLTLNTELLPLPRRLGEFVIVHELVHLLAPNHSKVFKAFMHAYLPDWQQRERDLRQQAKRISNEGNRLGESGGH